MQTMFFSPEVSLFASVGRDGPWFVGRVSALQGRSAIRVKHECLQLRATPAAALQDASNDARKLMRMWAEQVRF